MRRNRPALFKRPIFEAEIIVVCAILRWDGDLGYIIRIHGQEFNSIDDANIPLPHVQRVADVEEFFLPVFRTLPKVTISLYAWAAVLRPRSFAAGRPVYRLMIKRQRRNR